MKLKLLTGLLSIMIVFSNSVFCIQLGAITYGGDTIDGSSSIEQTKDGGYVVAGYTSSFGKGENDIWVIKFDKQGTVLWEKSYGGIKNDYPATIRQSSDNGYILLATTYSFGTGESDLWLLKLDSNGDISWQKTYGYTNSDFAVAAEETTDGGYILLGSTYSYGAGEADFWILKINASGDISWQKTYGGNGVDWPFSIQQTHDGGYIVGGETYSFADAKNDAWIVRLNDNGDISWQKSFGGSNFDWAFSLQQTADNGFIIVGNTDSFGAGENDVWLIKLDATGVISWEKAYGGSTFDWPSSVLQGSGGGYVISGGTYSFGNGQDDVWLLQLDKNGVILSEKTHGESGSDYATSFLQMLNGSYTVAGTTSLLNTQNTNLWILAVDDFGTIPNCALSSVSTSSITETSANVQETSVNAQTTSATSINTSVSALTTEAKKSEKCITPPACPGDFDHDGDVDGTDLAVFSRDFGRTDCNSDCMADFDSDGDVDGTDLSVFSKNFGRTDCPTL